MTDPSIPAKLVAAEARARPDDEPVEPGAFEGDIFFGDSAHTTRATHRWTNGAWKRLPSDEEVLMDLLGKARLRANTAEAALTKAEARVAVLEDALEAVDAEILLTELQAMLARVEAGEVRMRAARSDTLGDWDQGYALGAAETYGYVAHWCRRAIKDMNEALAKFDRETVARIGGPRGVHVRRPDLALGALQVAVKTDQIDVATGFAQTAIDFLMGNYDPENFDPPSGPDGAHAHPHSKDTEL